MVPHVKPSAATSASTHASVIASAGREARHLPPAAEQVASQPWPFAAPSCHVMPSLPHAQSPPGRCGGSGSDGGSSGGGGGLGGRLGGGGLDGGLGGRLGGGE